MFYHYWEERPDIGEGCFIAPGSIVIGKVKLGDHASLWFNTVVRGDVAPIEIGQNSNIQDLSVLHVTEDHPLKIGVNVSVGHRVVMHGCTVENSCLIGMGSVIMDNVIVGENSLVAAGSLLPPGKKYPGGSLIKGNPAKVARPLTDEEKYNIARHYDAYLRYKNNYLDKERFGPLLNVK